MSWPRFHFLMLGLAAFGVICCLGRPASGQTPGNALFRDLWQTAQARKFLQADPQLGQLNVGVKVTAGVAELWGPIPSPELSYRAEQRLRSMFELIEIRNDLAIEMEDTVTPPAPQSAPEPLSPATPREQRRPFAEPAPGVALRGIELPNETLTSRSSPLAAYQASPTGSLRLPFLGSIALPR